MINTQVCVPYCTKSLEELEQFKWIHFKADSAFDVVAHRVQIADHFVLSRKQSAAFQGELRLSVLDHLIQYISFDLGLDASQEKPTAVGLAPSILIGKST